MLTGQVLQDGKEMEDSKWLKEILALKGQRESSELSQKKKKGVNLGIYPVKTVIWRYGHPYVHNSTIYNSQDMETTEMSTDRQMHKDLVWYIKTMEYYSAMMNEIPFAATGMDLEIFILSEGKKDKYHVISLIFGIEMMTQMNYLWNRNRLIDTENRFVVAKGERGGGGKD